MASFPRPCAPPGFGLAQGLDEQACGGDGLWAGRSWLKSGLTGSRLRSKTRTPLQSKCAQQEASLGHTESVPASRVQCL